MSQRPGRRIHVQAAYGELIHEVRLSMDGTGWKAIVVTLPRQIWVAADGKSALTFRAETVEEAEALAVAFIESECVARGHRLANNRRPSRGGIVGDRPARRLSRSYPIRFTQCGRLGRAEAARPYRGETLNLSETGLFIATDEALYPGSRVVIDLKLAGSHERLDGVVVWSRMANARGGKAGMGIRLESPPLSYRSRIQSLRRPAILPGT